uniref:Uncharacterized protein n=1 Tax=Arundo donax TaxID=35708 RepID=A0A0A9B4S2_ARUDO
MQGLIFCSPLSSLRT